MATKILIRQDTSANWTANNPILSVGELGYETDTFRLKVGRGVAWNSQSVYFGEGTSTDKVGSMANLQTTAKDFIVNAINEVLSKHTTLKDNTNTSFITVNQDISSIKALLNGDDLAYDSILDLATKLKEVEKKVATIDPTKAIALYNALDRTEAGMALDAVQGKVLNDSISLLEARVDSFAGNGSTTGSTAGAGVSWLIAPKVAINLGKVSVTNASTNRPVADWNGVNIVYGTGELAFTFPVPATGKKRVDILVASPTGIYEVTYGEEGTSYATPSIVDNRLLVAYLLWGEGEGSVVAPEGAVNSVQVVRNGVGETVQQGDVVINISEHSHANKAFLDSLSSTTLDAYLKKTADADVLLKRVSNEYVQVLVDRIKTGFSSGGAFYTGNYSAQENYVTATNAGIYGDVLFKKDAANFGRILREEYAGGEGATEKKDKVSAEIVNSALETIAGYAQSQLAGDLKASTTDAAGVVTKRNIMGRFDFAEVHNKTTGEKSQAQAMLSASTEDGKAEAKVSYTHTNPDGTGIYHEWTLNANGFKKNGKRILTEDDLTTTTAEKFIPAQSTAPTSPADRQKWVDTSVTPPLLKFWDATLTTPVWVTVGGSSSITVVQTTGTSTTDVMSQDAVTKELATKEPVISTKGTAFNKNFGTAAGTVAEGNHSHADLEKFIVAQSTAPASPANRQKWVDTSLNPPVLKFWDATLATPAWVRVGGDSIEIVQVTGTSIAAVMSQDATTKELAKKQNLDEVLETLTPDVNNHVTLSMDNNRDCKILDNKKPATIKFGGTATFNKCRFVTVVGDGTAAPVVENMTHEVNSESVFRVATGTINRLRMRTDANNLGAIIVYYVWV